MRVNLNSLKKVVTEERSVSLFRQEVKRVLGDSVFAEGTIHQIAKEANDRLDVLEHTGRLNNVKFNQELANTLLEHSDVEVRKFIVKVIDKNKLQKLINDKSDIVRHSVAKRLPLQIVSEMVKRYPFDDQLVIIKKQKLLSEGISQPQITKVSDEKKKLGASVKQYEGDELSDLWYKDRAKKFFMDFGGNIEDGWEEVTAHRFVSSTKALTGVDIDEKKLLNAIKDELIAREERVISDKSLRETVEWLNSQDSNDIVEIEESEDYIDESQEEVDEIKDLNESLTKTDYINNSIKLFNIKCSQLPTSIKKIRVNESRELTKVPVVGMIPNNRGFTPIVEKSLNKFCKLWSEKQSENLKLEWGTHPMDLNKICFSVVMK